MSFNIKGADNQTIAIEDGEFYFNTKARARRMMQNSLSPEARRVYACLELATMGFQQELAVVMSNGKQRPITRLDIARQTGFSEPHVRRALVELENAGLVERRGVNDGPLYKGKVEIYSWALPREPKKKNGSQRAAPIPEWFPKSWEPLKPLVIRLKLRLLPELESSRGSLPETGEKIAREYQKAEKEAIALLKGVSAPSRLNKVERTERTRGERTEAASAISPSPGSGFIEPKPSSVGRSCSGVVENPEPTDRPMAGSVSKEEIREWMQAKVPIPGFALEEPELEQIAAAIKTPEHFEHFRQAAVKQKNPRGWKVYVKIARTCEQLHGTRAKGMSAAASSGESEQERRYNERIGRANG